jgi:hypothetical protein
VTFALSGSLSPLFATKGSTYGTTSTPGPANSILSYGTKFTETGDEVEVEQASMLPDRLELPHTYNRGWTVTTSFYLGGSGALGTPPGYNPLLRACGLSQVIVANTSVTLAPIDLQGSQEWIDLAGFLGRTRYDAAGCRGNLTLNYAAGQLPSAELEFQGIYAEPTQPGLPGASTFTAQGGQVLADSFNTSTFTLGGFAPAVSSFTLSLGNVITGSNQAGRFPERVITGRKITAEITIRDTDLSAFNAWALNANRTSMAMELVHGPATRQTKIVIPGFGIGTPTDTDVDGLVYKTFPLHVLNAFSIVQL